MKSAILFTFVFSLSFLCYTHCALYKSKVQPVADKPDYCSVKDDVFPDVTELKLGSTAPRANPCAELRCFQQDEDLYIQVATCGTVMDNPDCIKADLTKPYPDCCRIKCS